jgi:PBSX family phage terminase large subunit
MRLQVAKNFEFLLDNFSFEKAELQDKQGFVFEGGSGSAKTWDIIQFLMYYCQMNKDKDKDILIFRSTYAELKKTVLKDFIKILKRYGVYSLENHTKSHPQSYNLYGNIVYFTGLDGASSHGERHDVIWGNEGMGINFEDWKQLNQRCNELFIIDYNPSFTQHWIYDSIIPRKDTKFIKTTQLHNPFLPKGQRNEIFGYEPWETNSYQIEGDAVMYQGVEVGESHQPPPNTENIEAGTADESMWRIYGLGLRGAMKGVILSRVKYIENWPSHLPSIFGLDFGFTNDETALVRYAREGANIYVELLIYQPIDNPEDLDAMLTALGVSKYDPITADSADRYLKSGKEAVYMVRDLQEYGWEISKVSKTKRIVYWLQKLKKSVIHVVINDLSHHYKTEQQNYKWKEINGILINQPIDGFDHAITATRYARMSDDVNEFIVESN